MLLSTLARLQCPNCIHARPGTLSLKATRKKGRDVLTGSLKCRSCSSCFPILAGVALLVNDVDHYLRLHAHGISAFVPNEEVPAEHRKTYLDAKARAAHAGEEDLESERVNALYFATHYLHAANTKKPWWRPAENYSPVIDKLVRMHWDHGPFAYIEKWTRGRKDLHLVELGCGVGGLARALSTRASSYLGLDTSFAGIALARHVNLGAPYPLSLRLPQDLYRGALTGKVPVPKPLHLNEIDFVVAELECPPVPKCFFDLAVALNVIDVIEDPTALPALQRGLLKGGGIAITSSPYLWNTPTVAELRNELPAKIKGSPAAALYLYRQAGFELVRSEEQVPWLFLEHFRKLGLYSVHLFAAKKA